VGTFEEAKPQSNSSTLCMSLQRAHHAVAAYRDAKHIKRRKHAATRELMTAIVPYNIQRTVESLHCAEKHTPKDGPDERPIP
jgi:hypothetical protein